MIPSNNGRIITEMVSVLTDTISVIMRPCFQAGQIPGLKVTFTVVFVIVLKPCQSQVLKVPCR